MKELAKLREKLIKEAHDDELLSREFGPRMTTFHVVRPKALPRPKASRAVDYDAVDYSDCEVLSDTEIEKIFAKTKMESYCHCDEYSEI